MISLDGFLSLLWNFFLIVIVILVTHYVYLISNFNFWKKRGVFSPNPMALFGDLPGRVKGGRHIYQDLDNLYQKYKNSHSHIGIFNFRSPRLLIFDPEIVKEILIKYFKNFQATELFGFVDNKSDSLFGNHMFFLIGDEWKQKRQDFTPAFTNNRIKAIQPLMEDVFEKMKKFIKRESEKENFEGFEAKDLCARYTISVVSNSIYNVDPKTFDGGESELQKLAQIFLTPSKRMMIFMTLWSIYPFLKNFLKFGFAQPGAEKFFFNLMERSMKQREMSDIKQVDYLEYLIGLKNRKEISDSDIALNGATFLIDGFDTSSGTMASALYELARNKEVQDKLRDEINAKILNEDDFNYDNVMSLAYLDCVWYETLRLRNPLSHVARQCTEAIEIEFPKGKLVKFEVGDQIYIPAQSMFKDPDYFEDPLDFKPERFLSENGGVKQYIDRGVFYPFGLGPRNCPGSRFANAQGKYCLAALIRDFEISLNPKTGDVDDVHPEMIILYVTNCFLNFKPIEKK